MGVKYTEKVFSTYEAALLFVRTNKGQPGYSECYHQGPFEARDTFGDPCWVVKTKTYYG